MDKCEMISLLPAEHTVFVATVSSINIRVICYTVTGLVWCPDTHRFVYLFQSDLLRDGLVTAKAEFIWAQQRSSPGWLEAECTWTHSSYMHTRIQKYKSNHERYYYY